jgi:alpha-amylase/alpha-mannosidase (GH57 family)
MYGTIHLLHSHFYQPPRENPRLEAIEIQDSAYPYHDWNERITSECYAPNTAARNLDGEGRIMGIISNYSRISFNFGPTLLSWMEKYAPDTYRAILAADRQSIEWRSGHGAAPAQVYNHLIMPLANLCDKQTQVKWGIRDFEQRFQRFPEGMWLAETAVDTETMEVLAFEKLLSSGEQFADRLTTGFSPHRTHPQLNRISEPNRRTRDFTLNSLIKSIVEVIAFFPVYRTYINSLDVSERDCLP